MNLFDNLTNEALKNQPTLSSLRIVVEKELLHHDIIRIMRDQHLLTNLTFIGGTCLRACYGGVRLSEDLDFTGGENFKREQLSHMADAISESLYKKYALSVTVSEPIKESQNVDTWKIRIQTRPESKTLPSQRINIDVCALPSYEKRPMMLLNPYGVDMGTSGLIIQVQSPQEIYADKLIAFALRPNRLKYRDLWDISWLHGQGFKPNLDLIPHKLKDRKYAREDFLALYNERLTLLKNQPHMALEFGQEMNRFLPHESLKNRDDLWGFIIYLMESIKFTE